MPNDRHLSFGLSMHTCVIPFWKKWRSTGLAHFIHGPSQAVHAWSISSCSCMVLVRLCMHGPSQAVHAWSISSCACMVLVKQFMHGPSQAVHAWSYSSCSCMVLIKLQIIARLCRVHQKRWSRVGVKIKDGVRCSE